MKLGICFENGKMAYAKFQFHHFQVLWAETFCTPMPASKCYCHEMCDMKCSGDAQGRFSLPGTGDWLNMFYQRL